MIEDIWANRNRDYNIGCLVKRLQRIDKAMSAEAREMFAAFVPDGDLARYARGLGQALRDSFAETMTLLRNPEFQELLVKYPRPQRTFLRAVEHEDHVSSTLVFRDVAGNEYKPDDYLTQFAGFVAENKDHIEAVGILLDRPVGWSGKALTELREKLSRSRYRFTPDNLQRAHEARYGKALIDIVSMVKHAANEGEPLLTAQERVERAFARVTAGQTFNADQQRWLDRIREHMRENLSIDREDFDLIPAFADIGGLPVASRVFAAGWLDRLIQELNRAIAA